jgi:hypothetical protein
MQRSRILTLALFTLGLLSGFLLPQSGLYAQGRAGRGGGGAAPQNAKAAAVFDPTGYWVSVITEDWRYRMVTPTQGDYQGVPMTPEARKVANAWDPNKEDASDDVCKSYGAPALLRVPNRLHITWQDDQTLQMESDAGKQTRTFHFGDWKPAAGAPPTLQGDSVAQWERGGGRGATDGSLKVTTTHLRAGFLRKNGVPYSENANLVEYYDLIKQPNGDPLMVVTIITTDPTYLTQPFVVTSQYKKEASDAKWKPAACSAKW